MQNLREQAEKAVAGSEADFAEIVLVKQDLSSVVQAGISSENTGPVGRLTCTARAFVSNRWGLCEFRDPGSMREALDRAAAQAIHSSSPPVPFPMLAGECRDTFIDIPHGVTLSEIPLRQKAFLCKHYCELLAPQPAGVPPGFPLSRGFPTVWWSTPGGQASGRWRTWAP